MKLIDLLVQELPKRGGWPEGVSEIGQDYDGELMFYGRGNVRTGIYLTLSSDHRNIYRRDGDKVTKDRYESALAASQKPIWNGEGLPPVGVECEWLASGDHDWLPVTVLVYDGDGACLKPSDGSQPFFVGNICGFHPLRTKAERKRDDAKHTIAELCRSSASNGHAADLIYDAIAAGKIPGVKLDD